MKRPNILGITGGVASGKSEVTRILLATGAHVIDADHIGHQILQDPAVRNLLVRYFGQAIIKSDNQSVDRKKLANLVFGDTPQALARRTILESITHPPIRSQIHQELDRLVQANSSNWIVLDIPLLLESGWDRSCDEIWFVDAPLDQRLDRAGRRGWTQEQFQAREASQWPLERKKTKATRILWNGSTVDHLRTLVLDALRLSSNS